jgi:hypothetical protein
VRAMGGERSPVNKRTKARKNMTFASGSIDGKRVTGPAPRRVTAAEQNYAKFTRILVGYSAATFIFVSPAAEALEWKAFSLVPARQAQAASNRSVRWEPQKLLLRFSP